MSDHSGALILVVDDSSTMRRIMKMTLKKCGFENTEEAENGALGLQKAQTKQFDCIISDWNMPEMTGVEMVRELRKLPNYAKTPIMMVTTEGGKDAVVEALTAGVSSFIVKPFTADVLRKKMDSLWGD
ncbi:MAG: response regulator [Spartobacteria bacterium]|nr:response regulator [Spartobacteria bacterium]